MTAGLTQQALSLSDASLARLRGRATVRMVVPRYDRKRSIPGIVHIGVGGFNRSHLCVYLDDLLAMQVGGKRWAEFGVGLLPGDKQIHEALDSQDYIYGVLERDTGMQSYRVIGSLAGHLYAPEQHEAVLQRMTAPECEIISLTVTEGGYFLDDASGAFLADHPAVLHDLENPAKPQTWLGFVAEAAARRSANGGAPLTLLSCDNLQGNGHAARTALLAFAAMRSDDLGTWIEANVAFPNSMVDRITPRTTEDDRDGIAQNFGVVDLSPVVCEPFRQWVLEDEFAAGRPAWEHVGVKMTTDVAPYERTKMRLLNGGHFCIAYCAALLGIPYVADALADPLLRALLTQFLAEVRPTLRDLPGIDLNDYSASVIQRFSNATIRDQIARICSDGSAKVPKFILPSLADLLAAGTHPRILPRILPLVLASWLRYSRGFAEDGTTYAIADPGVAALAPFLAAGGSDAALALQVRPIFGDLAAQYPHFAVAVRKYLDEFRTDGVRATLTRALNRRPE